MLTRDYRPNIKDWEKAKTILIKSLNELCHDENNKYHLKLNPEHYYLRGYEFNSNSVCITLIDLIHLEPKINLYNYDHINFINYKWELEREEFEQLSSACQECFPSKHSPKI